MIDMKPGAPPPVPPAAVPPAPPADAPAVPVVPAVADVPPVPGVVVLLPLLHPIADAAMKRDAKPGRLMAATISVRRGPATGGGRRSRPPAARAPRSRR